MPPTLSVIIPVYNSASMLAICLAALAQSDAAPAEIIVVDDSSTDASAHVAEQAGARVLHLTGGPFGPGHARNQAAHLAQGDILVFIDADVRVHPNTLSQLAQPFAEDERIAAVFGSYDTHPAAPNFISQYKNLFHHFVHQQGREDATTFWAGCGAVRRSVFLALGGFDTQRYPRPSIEDIDLGYRLIGADHRIRLNKAAQATHLKHWTLLGMLRSDIFDRAIPWTRLSLQARHLPNDLNLRLSQRLSAVLTCLLTLYLVLTPLLPWPLAWRIVPLLLGIVTIVLLNLAFYRFFLRQRGPLFALAVIPLHLLYFLYSVAAFVTGTILHLLKDQP